VEDNEKETISENLLFSGVDMFELLTVNSFDIISILSVDGVIKFESKALERILGYKSDERLGKDVFNFVHPDDLEKVLKEFHEFNTNEGKTKKVEFRISHKNGSWVWLESIGQDFSDNPLINGIIVNSRDISERKKTEKALQESEENYRNLIFHSPDIVYKYSSTRGGLFWSPRVTDILGFSQSEILENPFLWFQSIHPDDQSVVKQAILDKSEVNDYVLEYRIKTKSGNWIWLRDNFMHKEITDDEIIVEGHASEITTKKIAEQKLQESEEKFKAIAEHTIDGLMILSNEYSVEYVSSSYKKILGHDEDDSISLNQFNIAAIIHPDDNVEILKGISEAIENAEKYHVYTFRAQHKDGHYIWRKDKARFIYDKNGKFEKAYLTCSDITKETEQQQIIEQQKKEMEQAVASKNKFFDIIAHDLKSPVSSILGFAELLQKNITKYSEEKVGKFITVIKSASEITLSLIENLLEWSRAQTNRIKFEPEKLIINNLLSDVIQQMDVSIRKKNIDIDFQSDEKITVRGDRNMLITVFRNLISNSIKFTPEGGQIKVEISENDRSEVEICVMDTGVGMEKETISKLFKIEEKVSTQGTNNERGTGLGLLLCKEFVDKHNGTILVNSELNKGSVFKVILPGRLTADH